MLLDCAVEPVTRGVRLLDDLGWRQDPDDTVDVPSVPLVVVQSGLVPAYTAILVIALYPGNLLQYVHVGDVLDAAEARICYRVIRLDVQDEYISGPLLTHLLQQSRRIGAIRKVNLDVTIDLVLELHRVPADHRS